MTIHFHSKHFAECKHLISLVPYMIILAYEQNPRLKIKDIQAILGMSERGIIRTRKALIKDGYLTEAKTGRQSSAFHPTDKLYQNEKSKHPVTTRGNRNIRAAV